MLSTSSNAACKRRWPSLMTCLVACSYIALATAGSLALSSCASTPKGVAREQALYNVATNAVTYLHQLAPSLPAPAGTLLEGVLAAGGALLALWATHLQRSVAELKNGHSKAAADKGPPKDPVT